MKPPSTRRPRLAQLLICQGCCCGRTDRGHPEVPVDFLRQAWKQRGLLKHVHLSISGCLGPCDASNVALVLTPGAQHWLGGLSSQEHYQALLHWATACAAAGQLLPLPGLLHPHTLARWSAAEAPSATAPPPPEPAAPPPPACTTATPGPCAHSQPPAA